MQTELEAKFLDINPDRIRRRLSQLGAHLVMPERLMRRHNFDFPDRRLEQQHSWLRIRDEGDKVTITHKRFIDTSLHGTKEINLVTSDFDTACQLALSLGLESKTYQETKRESWLHQGTQIEIDTWPWLPIFVELEGDSETALRTLAAELELDWAKALHGPVNFAYQHYYDIDTSVLNEDIEFKFGPVPDWLEAKRKTKAPQ